MFDSVTPLEQMCIRNELGEELLASVLGLPILVEGDTEQWQVSIYECLDPEIAATLYRSTLIAGMEGQGLDLDEENEACLRELLTDTDVAAIAAATLPEGSPASAAMVEDFQGKVLTCLAGLLLPDDGGPAAGPPAPDDSLFWQYSTGNPGELVIVSPTVIEGVVYAGSYENRVYALDVGTGALLWSFEAEGDLDIPPLVAGGVVFVEDLANLHALDASTGELLWAKSAHAALVSDGIVYIPTSPRDDDFSVSAVDAVSGEQLWATEMPRSGLPLLFPLTAAGSNVYVSNDHRVHALDSTTGKLVWTLDAGDPVTAPPTASNGVVFLRSYTAAYALDESTGEELWSHKVDSADSNYPPLIVDDVWYLNDSSLRALDAATGQLLWSFEADKEKADLRQAATGRPAVAEGMVFVQTEYLYKKTDAFHALNAATGDEVWSIDDDSGLTSIMVVDEVLYAHSLDGYLHTLDARTGEPIWSIAIGYHWWRYPYAVSAGVVYVGYQNADSGGIYAILAPGNSSAR